MSHTKEDAAASQRAYFARNRDRREKSLVEWIQREMPWPYTDVERDGAETAQAAFDLALDLLPVIERAWRPE